MAKNYQFLAAYSVIAKSAKNSIIETINQQEADNLRNKIRTGLLTSAGYTFYPNIETTFSGYFEFTIPSESELHGKVFDMFNKFKQEYDIANRTEVHVVCIADGVGNVEMVI